MRFPACVPIRHRSRAAHLLALRVRLPHRAGGGDRAWAPGCRVWGEMGGRFTRVSPPGARRAPPSLPPDPCRLPQRVPARCWDAR
eukprot:5644057-Pleurochrysis_carterae.AAC.1